MSTPAPTLPGGLRAVQIAYAVSDVDEAAASFAARFGAGPFVFGRHIPLAFARIGGEDSVFDHSSAYGQWGSVMVELVQVHDAGTGPVGAKIKRSSGLHHVACFVDDLDAAQATLTELGLPEAMLAGTSTGTRFAFHDGGELGHFIELYEPSPGLLAFYASVRDAATLAPTY